MTILDKIVERKRVEVSEAQAKVSIEELSEYPLFSRTCYSLKESVLDPQRTGIISEYKRASPSKGVINNINTVSEVVKGYQNAGASAISVLTDADFFQGSLKDLEEARSVLTIPLLRKEFIIDKYQIAEAKAYGADIILLIAACLTNEEVSELSNYAKTLGLNVLLEVHNEEELKGNLFDTVDAIGVNNRNLKDFSVSLAHSYDLVNKIPDTYIKVSESGISDPQTIRELKSIGYNSFLIGENFMKTTDPGKALLEFVKEI
ncbi:MULTISPECIES: indole-3-glycerol phosphate synthase TrpC [Sphingobacterium]|jgi:indole-3-glycerol phosphate synthase|uniref:Indole-3-glycerol phosphate synthase n=1 Tax=Sphingobacterium kitahiroshimense TaxID=470446 RepID=A0ABV0BRF9_9SPHI|nr:MULTISPECIES: indole-3-glycerol phosphate synthase TrpC [unclassified Sphingobacterium]MBB2953118.1 indole-3-glycerol phosphate synthase [Sphingobacterium sp. JUb56]NJI75306.1 indole-3-glycerol phosphate synthase TrpC [Sphingobacterium sp. B16(2022)]QQD14931.1 indole-3-glycerol phosphate synthase TrpC [Sphingobacterium sp. UDSM-2020]